MPAVPKLSAGYFAAPGMDLIDLFIGSEGTLGVITEVTLRVLPARPAMCLAFVPFADAAGGAGVRDAHARRRARDDWRTRTIRAASTSPPSSTWTRAASSCCARTAPTARTASDSPDRAAIALLVTLELPTGDDRRAGVRRDRPRRATAGAPDTPLVRFCRALDAAGVLDAVEIAVPGDRAREQQLLALARGGAGRRERARRPREAATSIRESRRPRPT